jgi:hypothetical protein
MKTFLLIVFVFVLGAILLGVLVLRDPEAERRANTTAREDNSAVAIRKNGPVSREAYMLAFKLCMEGQIHP